MPVERAAGRVTVKVLQLLLTVSSKMVRQAMARPSFMSAGMAADTLKVNESPGDICDTVIGVLGAVSPPKVTRRGVFVSVVLP